MFDPLLWQMDCTKKGHFQSSQVIHIMHNCQIYNKLKYILQQDFSFVIICHDYVMK